MDQNKVKTDKPFVELDNEKIQKRKSLLESRQYSAFSSSQLDTNWSWSRSQLWCHLRSGQSVLFVEPEVEGLMTMWFRSLDGVITSSLKAKRSSMKWLTTAYGQGESYSILFKLSGRFWKIRVSKFLAFYLNEEPYTCTVYYEHILCHDYLIGYFLIYWRKRMLVRYTKYHAKNNKFWSQKSCW